MAPMEKISQRSELSDQMKSFAFLVTAWLACATFTHAADLPGIVKSEPADGRFVKVESGFMIPYEVTIPGTDATFWMEPIPGGEFLMGSGADEAGHNENEGPQRKFKVSPFWMARCEVSWKEYKNFMSLYGAFKSFQQQKLRLVTDANRIDAITAPTPLYEPDFTFEFGEDDAQPAVSMSQYAAKQYSKWMSAITECQYRLPTEAEWEYACRAGSQSAFSFGDDPEALAEYAWFEGNAAGLGGQKIGQKKPNAWGLHDMHGNVAEWVLDTLEPYKPSYRILDASVDCVPSEELDPRIVRGGSWEFPAEQCRSASRLGSDTDAWREYDPNLPKSPWWLTNDPVSGVGFRLIRPLATTSRENMEVFWKIDNEATQYDVQDRLTEGRGVEGLVDKDLPAAIKSLD